MRIVLGIDPGLASTGYGVIRCEGSRIRHVAHGAIHTSPREEAGSRLVRLHDELARVIDAYHPDGAGVETVYFSKNSSSAIPVAQARGVLLYTLAERGVPFAEYTPGELKQAIVGRSRAEKVQMQQTLRVLFQLPEIPTPDHAADALAAALCHANTSRFISLLEQGHA
ncbi:MAG: crossover junction endodeoxyribonuclease RuvC [Spirochaetales bacterium]|nr:crossover junction endodeoxyribonuclease RuvC [Spirochaetales bacterium]